MNLWVTIPTNGERDTVAITLSSLLQQRFLPTGLILCENGESFASSHPTVLEMIKFLRARNVSVIIEIKNLPPEGFTKLRHELLLSVVGRICS